MTADINKRLDDLMAFHSHKSYQTDYFKKIKIESFFVGEKVLRPELSYVSKYLTHWLYNNNYIYINKKVVEIGCGSGIQSICMCLNGAKSVLATDISDWALNSTATNKTLFRINGNFSLRKGDMFDPLIKTDKFDFALFNHPFFEGKPKNNNSFESSLLDDRELAGVFLEKIWDYMNINSVVLMPYSQICGKKNDPVRFAKELGINYSVVNQFKDENGIQQIILFNK
jgi:methylase of polypeptide subunit release factors